MLLAQGAALGNLGWAGGHWSPICTRTPSSALTAVMGRLQAAELGEARLDTEHASGLAHSPFPAMAEEARAGDKGQSSLKKILPGPGLSGTLLPDPMAECKAKRAVRLHVCLHAALPVDDRGHGLTVTTGTSRQATHPQTLALHGAATAQVPGPGWEETGRDKFISSSVSFFRSHFWDNFLPPKNTTQNLIWTKTRA